jgi:hypothetical protein
MSEVLMTLGDIRFSVTEGAYRQLSRVLEMRVARMERAGGQAGRQILGEDETVELEGVCYPTHRHALDRLDSFRALARAKKAAMLTDGRGQVWGEFVIERVEERGDEFLSNGVAQRQDFRISLGAVPQEAV